MKDEETRDERLMIFSGLIYVYCILKYLRRNLRILTVPVDCYVLL